MRNIATVIGLIIRQIPDTWEQKNDLQSALLDVVDSANYTAPESMSVRWQQMSELLEDYLGDPTEQWKKDIGLIVSGKV